MATATKTAPGTSTAPANRGEPKVEDLATQIETLKSDLAALMKASGAYGSAKARELAGHARDHVHAVRSEGERYAEEAGRIAAQNADAAIAAVRRKPVTALAIAAGVGFLFGMVTTGRR